MGKTQYQETQHHQAKGALYSFGELLGMEKAMKAKHSAGTQGQCGPLQPLPKRYPSSDHS